MKAVDSVKDLEVQAVDAAQALLSKVPTLDILSVEYEHEPSPDKGVDGRIAFRHDERVTTLLIEVKAKGAPSFIRNAIFQLRNHLVHADRTQDRHPDGRIIPMVASAYLSPESRALCEEYDVAYVDTFGNARLVFDTVFIERTVADKPKSESRALRSIFSPKAAAILRVLLREPGRPWLVSELAECADVSFGHVSNVRKALLEREWIEPHDGGVILAKPDALLASWRDNYRKPVGQTISGYTHLHGAALNDRLKGVLGVRPDRPRIVLSSHSAASWYAPFGRTSVQSFYADKDGAEALREALELSPISKGSNIQIRIIKDESLFTDADEPAPGIFCVSPIITYLDLWNGSERHREAAEHLGERIFPWLH